MTKTANAPDLQMEKVRGFQERVLRDVAGLVSIMTGSLGDKLYLYKGLAEAGGPVTPSELAEKTGLTERYVREWLINQAASEYVDYDPATGKYWLPAEHAMVLCDENSPFFAAGFFQSFAGFSRAVPRIAECFQNGKGMLWGEHDPDVFTGVERLFRPTYVSQLIANWIPAVDGLQVKLAAGAKVADVGCGHGLSTNIMAKAFPNSRYFGFDNHVASIERARKEAEAAGTADIVKFEACDAGAFPGEEYDLIAFFDCLHDMGDPVAACRRASQTLKKDGIVMIVEPMAGNTVEENFNMVGRVYSGASVMCCTPNAVASGKHSLGTIATDKALEEVTNEGGLKKFRRVAETPFNRVFVAEL